MEMNLAVLSSVLANLQDNKIVKKVLIEQRWMFW